MKRAEVKRVQFWATSTGISGSVFMDALVRHEWVFAVAFLVIGAICSLTVNGMIEKAFPHE